MPEGVHVDYPHEYDRHRYAVVKSIAFDPLFADLVRTLETDSRLKRAYPDEPSFERAVWGTLYQRCAHHFGEDWPPKILLSSHDSLNLSGRSQAEWDAFLVAGHADLVIFEAKKRVDLALRHPDGQLIGIEIECLTQAKPADAFVIGLGQTLLALGHRQRVILAAHCGNPTSAQRDELLRIAARISEHPHVRILLVP